MLAPTGRPAAAVCAALIARARTGVGQVAFPGNANGQQVKVDGKLVGSKIIGQQFADQVVKNGKPQFDKDGNPGYWSVLVTAKNGKVQ